MNTLSNGKKHANLGQTKEHLVFFANGMCGSSENYLEIWIKKGKQE